MPSRTSSMVRASELPPEIDFTLIGPEECPDDAVGIERDERARAAVEARDHAVVAPLLENRPAGGPIAKLLSPSQVLSHRDVPELPAVLEPVLPQELVRPKSDVRAVGGRGRGCGLSRFALGGSRGRSGAGRFRGRALGGGMRSDALPGEPRQ